MTISLTPEQQDWVVRHIEHGEFASVDEAARQLIAEREIEADDLGWAKPLVDEALAEVERGEVVSAAALHEHMSAVLTRLAG